jgi:hypothetical protein
MNNRTVSLTEQVQCAERELEKRRRLYPRWVSEGKLNELKAAREIEAMAAICQTLESLHQPELPKSPSSDGPSQGA